MTHKYQEIALPRDIKARKFQPQDSITLGRFLKAQSTRLFQ